MKRLPGYRVFPDGPRWFAVGPNFIDMAVSPDGDGATPEAAIKNLFMKPDFQEWLRKTGAPVPSLADFQIEEGTPLAQFYILEEQANEGPPPFNVFV